MKTLLPLLLILVIPICSGCGSDAPTLVEVSGRVMLAGKPLTAGSITFHPAEGNPFQSDTPSSQLQLDGSFRMKTFPWGYGVPPGDYQVTLSPELAGRINRPECADRIQTPLKITVPVSPLDDYEFNLE